MKYINMKYKEFVKKEMEAIINNDPAIKSKKEVYLYPSYKVMKYYYISNYLYNKKHFYLARLISERGKRKSGIEIHPAAIIKEGVFIDHGSAVVIGGTSVVGKNVIMFHGATLGGLGNVKGKRHPTIKDNVIIGSGAKILGNITIGENSKIGANSVVLKDIPDNATAVGIPAKIVKLNGKKIKDRT